MDIKCEPDDEENDPLEQQQSEYWFTVPIVHFEDESEGLTDIKSEIDTEFPHSSPDESLNAILTEKIETPANGDARVCSTIRKLSQKRKKSTQKIEYQNEKRRRTDRERQKRWRARQSQETLTRIRERNTEAHRQQREKNYAAIASMYTEQ